MLDGEFADSDSENDESDEDNDILDGLASFDDEDDEDDDPSYREHEILEQESDSDSNGSDKYAFDSVERTMERRPFRRADDTVSFP